MASDMELHAMACLLRSGRTLDGLSTGLALVGALIGLAHGLLPSINPWFGGLGAALLMIGVIQKYWAFRVAFDADLLQYVAGAAQPLADSTQALDAALAALGLVPACKTGRPWRERLRGAADLLYWQAALLAVQIILTLGFIVASPWLINAG
jgi:hypothetical protein